MVVGAHLVPLSRRQRLFLLQRNTEKGTVNKIIVFTWYLWGCSLLVCVFALGSATHKSKQKSRHQKRKFLTLLSLYSIPHLRVRFLPSITHQKPTIIVLLSLSHAVLITTTTKPIPRLLHHRPQGHRHSRWLRTRLERNRPPPQRHLHRCQSPVRHLSQSHCHHLRRYRPAGRRHLSPNRLPRAGRCRHRPELAALPTLLGPSRV